LLVSSIYTSTPEPAADGSNQTDVARALKQTSEALIRKNEELEAAIKELQTAVNTAPPEDPASIITGATSSAGGGNLTPASDIVDPILDRAVELSNAAVRQAQAETKTVLAALQTALENFKAGYDDTNAVVNTTLYDLTAQVGDNTARITEEELVRATTTQALAGRVGKITSVMNSNSAAITTEAVTRATADSALAAQITTVEAQTNSNTAAITAETIARTTADSALSAQITTVDAKANDATANGFYRLTATANTNGAVAEFAVQLRATSTGSYADAGMHIQAFSGGNRRVKFYTDQFIVTTGPDAYQPFAISGGNVYANDLIVGNANIENAAITSAKIGTAEVETLKIAGNAVTVPAAYIYGPIIYGNGSLQLIANLSFTMPYAGEALITFFGTHVYATAFPYDTYFLDFYLDGTVIGGVYNGSTYPEVGVVFSTLRTLSAGSHNVQVYWNGSSGTIGIGNIALSSVGAMR
jgi:hypothetical protein